MIGRDFFLRGVLEILHARAHLLDVDIAKASIEQDLAREQAELETELLVVDGRIPPQIQ